MTGWRTRTPPAIDSGGPTASALNHPHIITIHEIESADGIDFLVMEYVRGRASTR